jgi:pteridine reductase
VSNRQAIWITGAARRVGAATALYCAKRGYDIALHYQRSESEAKALQEQIKSLGSECRIFSHDLADIKGLPGLATKVKQAFPRCTALVNNASVFERAGLMETDEALFDRQMDINFKAPFFLTQAFVKTFGEGSVVNILDTDVTGTGTSHFAYLLSKKALLEFTRMAARELGPKIRVGGVCPGSMLPSAENPDGYEDKVAKLIPLKENPSLDELAEAVLWLTQQRHVTGQVIFVDGGKHVL